MLEHWPQISRKLGVNTPADSAGVLQEPQSKEQGPQVVYSWGPRASAGTAGDRAECCGYCCYQKCTTEWEARLAHCHHHCTYLGASTEMGKGFFLSPTFQTPTSVSHRQNLTRKWELVRESGKTSLEVFSYLYCKKEEKASANTSILLNNSCGHTYLVPNEHETAFNMVEFLKRLNYYFWLLKSLH